MNTLIVDLETDGLLPTLSTVWCIAITLADGSESAVYADARGYPPIADGLERLRRADRIVMHNGLGFDLHVLHRFWPGVVPFERVYDTLVVSRLLNPEERTHSLEDWGVRLGHHKVEHEDWTRFSDDMAHRCKEDVAITAKLYNLLEPKVRGWGESVELEHQVRLVIALQEQNGFKLNVEKAQRLEATLRQEQTDVERELQTLFPPVWVAKRTSGTAYLVPGVNTKEEITQSCVRIPKVGNVKGKGQTIAGAEYTAVELLPFNPGSRHQVSWRLMMKGWAPTKFTEGGTPQVDDNVLQELAKRWPECGALARYFRIEKQLGQLTDGKNGWLKLVNSDGRVYGAVNTCGAVTGRMAHFAPNMAQVDKKDLRMREVWEPRSGWKLVGADAEGLELRMLGHYLARFDGDAYSKAVVEGRKEDGTDVHSIAQKLLKFHKRDNVKRSEYAYLYGAGDPKLGVIAIEDALDTKTYNKAESPHLFNAAGRPLSPKAIGAAHRTALQTGIKGLDPLVTAVKDRHRVRKYITGLDGRHIKTKSQHSALNTLLQGAGAVVMKKALVIFHFELAKDAELVSSDFLSTNLFAYCANVHDEVQIEAEDEHAPIIGELFCRAITLAGERLNVKCVLTGSYQVGANWKETH